MMIFSLYLSAQLLLAVGFFLLLFFTLLLRKNNWRFSFKHELRLHYKLLLFIFLLLFLQPVLPATKIIQPVAKVWSAQSMEHFSKHIFLPHPKGYLDVSVVGKQLVFQTDIALELSILLVTCLLLIGSFRFWAQVQALYSIRKKSYTLKKIGHVSVLLNENISIPFSYAWWGKAYVVLPLAMLHRRQDYTMTVMHELQHHRQGDTSWVYIFWFMRLFFFCNPCVYFWNRWIAELQEFACDEALVDQNKVSLPAYTRCLFEVAKSANEQSRFPACATGLLFLFERNVLKRRIKHMYYQPKKRIGRSIRITLASVVAFLLVATTYAAKGFVQDRRVNMEQAKIMVEKAQRETAFPIVLNDLVLKQLNVYIGTMEGREYMRKALARMEQYRPLIEGKMKKYQVPTEFLAMPVIESAYQNLKPSANPRWKAAGLWQFIASTARKFGLKVGPKVDERMDVEQLTDAAMRYLQANYLLFQDWYLSALAYNMGERAVLQAIERTGSRDAWVLVRKGYEGDKEYLAKLLAAMVILKNPTALN